MNLTYSVNIRKFDIVIPKYTPSLARPTVSKEKTISTLGACMYVSPHVDHALVGYRKAWPFPKFNRHPRVVVAYVAGVRSSRLVRPCELYFPSSSPVRRLRVYHPVVALFGRPDIYQGQLSSNKLLTDLDLRHTFRDICVCMYVCMRCEPYPLAQVCSPPYTTSSKCATMRFLFRRRAVFSLGTISKNPQKNLRALVAAIIPPVVR